jgi:hypothetical protein
MGLGNHPLVFLVKFAADLFARFDARLLLPVFVECVDFFVLESRTVPVLLPTCAWIRVGPTVVALVHRATMTLPHWFPRMSQSSLRLQIAAYQNPRPHRTANRPDDLAGETEMHRVQWGHNIWQCFAQCAIVDHVKAGVFAKEMIDDGPYDSRQ